MEHRGRTFVRAQSASSRSRSLMDRRDIDIRDFGSYEDIVRDPKLVGTLSMGESRCHGGNATSSTGEKNENTDTGVVNAPTNADKRDISVDPNNPV